MSWGDKLSNSFFSNPIIHKSKEVKDYNLGKTHDVKVKANIVMPILAESIYKNPLSSIRELYNNEKTACYKARKLGLKNQRIEIKINTETRDLTIQGFNSIGISKSVFNDIILNVGVSGNNSQDSIGMFGLGLYSYSLLSENCIISTKSLEDKEIKTYLGKSALNFEEIENQEELKEYGTKFYLNLKDNLEFEDIINKIKEIVQFSDIPTILIVDDLEHSLIQYDDIFDYFNKAINHSWNSQESIVYNFVKTDDYDIIYYKKEGKSNRGYNGNESLLLLLNTPIQYYKTFYNFEYIVNIKNEKLFTPNPSRDFFSDEVKLIIDDLIESKFTEFEGTDKIHSNIKEWYKDDLKWFNFEFGTNEDIISSWYLKCKDVKKPRKKRESDLSQILPDEMPNEFLFNVNWDKRLYDKMTKDNKFIVFISESNVEHYKKIGFKEYKLSKKEIIAKSKTQASKKLTKSFKFHTKRDSQDLPTKYVIKTSDLNKDKWNLRYSGFNSDVSLITHNADYKECLLKDDVSTILENTIFTTSKGIKDLGFIEENLSNIEFIDTSVTLTNQVGLMLPHNNILVLANPDIMAFICLIYDKNIQPSNHYKTHYVYFKSIFEGTKLNILESIDNKYDYKQNTEFYYNMKYLRDNLP